MGGWVVLWVFLALVALLVLVLLLPVGIRIRYGHNGFKLWYAIGPIRILHRPKDDKTQQRDTFTFGAVLRKPNKNEQKANNILSEFWADLKILLELFGYLRPKLRIKYLVLKLRLAGFSPATMAIEYGGAWAALGCLVPLLEEAFIIKKRELDVDCDFSGDTTTLDSRLDISIGLGRLLWCLLRYGIGTFTKAETKHTERR